MISSRFLASDHNLCETNELDIDSSFARNHSKLLSSDKPAIDSREVNEMAEKVGFEFTKKQTLSPAKSGESELNWLFVNSNRPFSANSFASHGSIANMTLDSSITGISEESNFKWLLANELLTSTPLPTNPIEHIKTIDIESSNKLSSSIYDVESFGLSSAYLATFNNDEENQIYPVNLANRNTKSAPANFERPKTTNNSLPSIKSNFLILDGKYKAKNVYLKHKIQKSKDNDFFAIANLNLGASYTSSTSKVSKSLENLSTSLFKNSLASNNNVSLFSSESKKAIKSYEVLYSILFHESQMYSNLIKAIPSSFRAIKIFLKQKNGNISDLYKNLSNNNKLLFKINEKELSVPLGCQNTTTTDPFDRSNNVYTLLKHKIISLIELEGENKFDENEINFFNIFFRECFPDFIINVVNDYFPLVDSNSLLKLQLYK